MGRARRHGAADGEGYRKVENGRGAASTPPAAGGSKGGGKGKQQQAAGTGKGGGKGVDEPKRPDSWKCFSCQIVCDSRGCKPCPQCSRPCPPHICNWGKKGWPAGGGRAPAPTAPAAGSAEAELVAALARIKALEDIVKKSGKEDQTAAATGGRRRDVR